MPSRAVDFLISNCGLCSKCQAICGAGTVGKNGELKLLLDAVESLYTGHAPGCGLLLPGSGVAGGYLQLLRWGRGLSCTFAFRTWTYTLMASSDRAPSLLGLHISSGCSLIPFKASLGGTKIQQRNRNFLLEPKQMLLLSCGFYGCLIVIGQKVWSSSRIELPLCPKVSSEDHLFKITGNFQSNKILTS